MRDIKYIIADNVKLYRKKENLTQMEVAEREVLSLDSIKRIERGMRTMSLENFLRVSDALHVPLSYLLYEEREEAPEIEQIKEMLQGKSAKQRKFFYICFLKWLKKWTSYYKIQIILKGQFVLELSFL